MTKEEMNLKIKELTEENQKLKLTLEKATIPKHPLCPKDIALKHGGLMKKGKAYEYNHFSYMSVDDLTDLSRIIRRCCFPREEGNYGCTTVYSPAKYTYKQTKYEKSKKLKDLTDEEYAKYSEVLDRCLFIFEEFGIIQDNY